MIIMSVKKPNKSYFKLKVVNFNHCIIIVSK